MQNQVEYFALIISKEIIKTLSKKHVSFKKKGLKKELQISHSIINF